MGYGQYSACGRRINPFAYQGMPKQRKTVFGTHAHTAHVWAQQNEDTYCGRSSDGRMFFEGASIFSYRSSWTIARFVTNKRGQRAVLFNSDTCSISTAKHTHHAHNAVRGLGFPVFELPNPERDPDKEQTRRYFFDKLSHAINLVTHARTNAEWRMRDAERIANNANALSAFFGWRWRLKRPEWSPEFIAQAKTRAAKEKAKRAAETKRKEALRQADIKDRITAWLAGENVSTWGYAGPVLLRVLGDNIQTSRGATVPVSHAKRAWPLIKACKESATAWRSNGHSLPIGHFNVDRIEADGTLKIGCHVIEYGELERIARTLGVET
jgi:hypothetical protein